MKKAPKTLHHYAPGSYAIAVASTRISSSIALADSPVRDEDNNPPNLLCPCGFVLDDKLHWLMFLSNSLEMSKKVFSKSCPALPWEKDDHDPYRSFYDEHPEKKTQ